MSEQSVWRPKLHAFFDQRARSVQGVPTHDELCYIAGRDPRVWLDPVVREDLTQSILGLSGAAEASHVLEVGCAAGFLAQMIAPRVGRFVGVDLAGEPLVVARRLGFANATFQQAAGEHLPFPDSHFDAVFCYDVFTNIPDIEIGFPLIRAMLRVVKPRGKVLVGSIPDKARMADLPPHIAALQEKLTADHGPVPAMRDPVPPVEAASSQEISVKGLRGFLSRLRRGREPAASDAREAAVSVAPEITCYEFARQDFVALGQRLDAEVIIHEVHARHPYFGFRFNAVFTKAGG